MRPDAYTKGVLTVIAACLVWLCAMTAGRSLSAQQTMQFGGMTPQPVFVEVVCAPTPRLEEKLRRHALDLALVSIPDERDSGVLRREALVWVGNRHDDAGAREPLQLALGDPDTLDHRAAREGLDAVARP